MGGLGVSFFIVISGGGIYNSIKSHFSPLVFYKKRLLSIFPTYYVAYIVTALFLFLFAGRVVFQGDFSKVIWTFLGLDGFLSQRTPTFYLIGEWFIGFIIFMYLLFPLIKFFYVKNRFFTFLIAVIISALSIHYNNFMYENIPFWNKRDIWNPTARLPEFVMGMILFEAIADGKTRLLKILFFVSISVVLGYAIHDHRDMVINEFRNIPLFMSSLILLVTFYQYGLTFLHGNNIVSFFSKYSFLAFLYHHQILSVISMKINFYQLDRTGLVFCCIIAITLSFTLAYGTFSFSQNFKNYLEKTFRNKKFVK
jgi:peptidoglycan/LPS O-acetylase OafA/YrhL